MEANPSESTQFSIGDIVLYRPPEGPKDKMQPEWLGPATITGKTRSNTYVIHNIATGTLRTLDIGLLKKYNHDPLVSDFEVAMGDEQRYIVEAIKKYRIRGSKRSKKASERDKRPEGTRQQTGDAAAMRLGDADVWHQLFTDGTSRRQTEFQNLIIGLMEDGKLDPVVVSSCMWADDGTAENQIESILVMMNPLLRRVPLVSFYMEAQALVVFRIM